MKTIEYIVISTCLMFVVINGQSTRTRSELTVFGRHEIRNSDGSMVNHVPNDVELIFTIGSQQGKTYTERKRFTLKLNSTTPIGDALPQIQAKYVELTGRKEYANYIYLVDSKTDEILDLKKTFEDYKLQNGSVVRLFVNIR